MLNFIVIKIVFVFQVSPETVVVPIVSSIIGFPILALLVICCLRKRAKMARYLFIFYFFRFFFYLLNFCEF